MDKIKIPITNWYQLHITSDYIAIAQLRKRAGGDKYEEISWFSSMEHALKKLVQVTMVDEYSEMSLVEFLEQWSTKMNDYTKMINTVLEASRKGCTNDHLPVRGDILLKG